MSGKKVKVKDFFIGAGSPLAFISGPCVIESEDHSLRIAEKLKQIVRGRPVNLIFKASFDKANRSAHDSFRGPGLDEGLKVLARIQREFDLPVVTDVHTEEQARAAGQVCDMIQIPAFLCRQTDLVAAAAKTGAVVSVKKGQFMAPWDMSNVVAKITKSGNDQIILIERGATFGYNNLVSDMRAMPILKGLGYPVCFDATHSAQLPGGLGASTGGQREFIPILAKAAIAAGADCLFMECHPEPAKAKSDAATVYPLDQLSDLLTQLEQLYALCQQWNK
jgi:2-dehydro-3-deoxyphosphooctonate aldolase (KDO 8-P synthase)